MQKLKTHSEDNDPFIMHQLGAKNNRGFVSQSEALCNSAPSSLFTIRAGNNKPGTESTILRNVN